MPIYEDAGVVANGEQYVPRAKAKAKKAEIHKVAGQVVGFERGEKKLIPRTDTDKRATKRALRSLSKFTYRLPNVFPQRAQLQANGFSLVWVRSCLWTCSTRLIMMKSVSQHEKAFML